MHHCVPYMLTNTGLAYRKSKVKDPEPSWAMFDRADLKGRMTMLERHARDHRRRPQVPRLQPQHHRRGAARRGPRRGRSAGRRTSPSSRTSSTRAASPRASSCSSTATAATSCRCRPRTPTWPSLIPQEGHSHRLRRPGDPEGRRGRSALAHAFINFLHDPEVAAENTRFLSYLCPNRAAYAKLARRSGQPGRLPGPGGAGEERGRSATSGADNAKYVKVWDQIKAAP